MSKKSPEWPDQIDPETREVENIGLASSPVTSISTQCEATLDDSLDVCRAFGGLLFHVVLYITWICSLVHRGYNSFQKSKLVEIRTVV